MNLFKKLILPLFLLFFLFLGFLVTPAKAHAYDVYTHVFLDTNGDGYKQSGESCFSGYYSVTSGGSNSTNLISNCTPSATRNKFTVGGYQPTVALNIPSGYFATKTNCATGCANYSNRIFSGASAQIISSANIFFGIKLGPCYPNGGTCNSRCFDTQFNYSAGNSSCRGNTPYCCVNKKDDGKSCSSDSADYECKNGNCKYDRHEDGRNYYVCAATPPVKPTNLSTARACSGTSSNISFNWSAVGGATSYVFRLNDYRGVNIKEVRQTSPNYWLQGSAYSAYYQSWSVQACKTTTNCSDRANGNDVTALNCAPAAPQAPSLKTPITRECTGNNLQKVTFGWYSVTGATKYQVIRTPGWTDPKDVTAIAYVDQGIASNTTYTYKVRACSGGTCGNYASTTLAAKTCAAPTTLTCSQRCAQENRFCGSLNTDSTCKCTSALTDSSGTCKNGATCRRVDDGETVGYYCGSGTTTVTPTPSGCSATDRKDPALELRYTSDRILTAKKGEQVKYRLQLKNKNETGCGKTTFTFDPKAPSGWDKSITGGEVSSNKITIAANDNSWHNVNLLITSPNSATAGNYDVSISVTGDPGHSASINNLTYVVKSGSVTNPTPTPKPATPTPKPATPTPTPRPECTTNAQCSNNNTCINGSCQSQFACSGNQCVKTVGGQYAGPECGGNCTPGPTENPTPTPTEGPNPTPPSGGMRINFLIGLHNLGSTGDSKTSDPNLAGSNPDPRTRTRNFEVLFLTPQEEAVASFNDNIIFNDESNSPNIGKFIGHHDFENNEHEGRNYIVKVRSSGYLWKRIPGGVQTLIPGAFLPLTELVSGDINMDNQINLSDFQIYRSCSIYSRNEGLCNGNQSFRARSDINDDGIVDSIDQTMLQKEMSVRQGD